VTCDFTHPDAYLRNKWITLSHPFSCVGYKTVIAVDISPRSLFIIVECVLQAYTVYRYVLQNDITSVVAKWLNKAHRWHTNYASCVFWRKHMDRVLHERVCHPKPDRDQASANMNEQLASSTAEPLNLNCTFIFTLASLIRIKKFLHAIL